MRGILHHPQVVPPGKVVEPVHIDRQPGEVHRQDGTGSRRDRGFHLVQIDVAGIEADIHEHRVRADPYDDVRRRDEAQRGRDHLVALTDPAREQSHFEPRRSGGLGAHRSSAKIARKRRLELHHLRTAGDPTGP